MEIVFLTSTAPSINPTENGGRLINAYAEKAPDGSRSKIIIRRSPGLDFAFTAGEASPRGMKLVGSVLYIVNGDTMYAITKSGTVYDVTPLGGTVSGTGPVIIVHNMKAPTADVLIQTSAGIDKISGGTVSSFSDADLPSTNSLTFMDSYFFFTTAAGRCYSSGVNDITVGANDYVTAEAQPDGLVRAVAIGRDLLLMGTTTTEFYSNVGNATGFPFSRGPVIPIGLLSTHCVAGFEPGFPGPVIFVGDGRVIYRLDGYSAVRISRPNDERMLQAVSDVTQLRASVFVSAGHAFWVLRGPDWTMIYDISTGEWHERQSIGQETWRAIYSVNAFGEWLVCDEESGDVYRVNDRSFREAGGPLVYEVRSTQMHAFPSRQAVVKASFDMVTGIGEDRGLAPIQTTPRVSISWSDDGGRTFASPLLRSLGTQGQVVPIDIYRTGLTQRVGRQWRLQVSDPVEVALMGGSMFAEGRA